MKRRMLAVLLIICNILLFSCSGEAEKTDDMMQHELRMLYKKSSAVLKAECNGYVSDDAFAVLSITQQLFGASESVVYCERSKKTPEAGKQYLLFLHSENTGKSYSSDEYTVMETDSDVVKWNKKKYALSDVEDALKSINDVVYMAPYMYFYDKREELYKNSDVIIIGKPSGNVIRSEKTVYSSIEAAAIENVLACIEHDIRVVGVFKGEYKNGDTIKMVYMPDLLSSMIDANTLSTISADVKHVLHLDAGEYYLFFLRKGSDIKQDYYMPVNLIQGWVKLDGDNFIRSEKNVLFDDCAQLSLFAADIKNADKNSK